MPQQDAREASALTLEHKLMTEFYREEQMSHSYRDQIPRHDQRRFPCNQLQQIALVLNLHQHDQPYPQQKVAFYRTLPRLRAQKYPAQADQILHQETEV